MSTLKFLNYKVNELSFKTSGNPEPGKTYKVNPKINIDIRKIDSRLMTYVSAEIDNDERGGDAPFIAKASLTGFFEVTGEPTPDELKEATVGYMFPYLRSTMSLLTLTANIDTFYLPIINFQRASEAKERDSITIKPLDPIL